MTKFRDNRWTFLFLFLMLSVGLAETAAHRDGPTTGTQDRNPGVTGHALPLATLAVMPPASNDRKRPFLGLWELLCSMILGSEDEDEIEVIEDP